MSDKIIINKYNELVERIVEENITRMDNTSRMAAGVYVLPLNVICFLRELSSEFEPASRVLIPDMLSGEMSLCVDEYIGYSSMSNINEIIIEDRSSSVIMPCDFLKDFSNQKYQSILLFPPLGARIEGERERSEVLYFEKCLDLLEKGGRMLALVPQNMLVAPAFKSLRERIISEFSIEAVFKIDRISRGNTLDFSVIIIENKIQSRTIYMTNGADITKLYSDYKSERSGFRVNADEVYDRLDSQYYDPEYKETRELIRNKNTIKLSTIANVFSGMLIPSQERKEEGDYLVIKPQYIFDNKLHLGNQRKVYCSKSFVKENRLGEKVILKKGDILISLIGKIDWAIYDGEEDFAIANQNVGIIRGRVGNERQINLFFNTKTGIEHLETQLKFLSHCGLYNHVSIRNLYEMVIPDQKMMELTDNVSKAIDFEAKVSGLFRDLGWNVQEGYTKKNYYDLALFEDNVLKGVVEIKRYNTEQLKKEKLLLSHLAILKESIGEAKVFLFVDDGIFEYKDEKVVQLPELPRPNTEIVYNKTIEKRINTTAELVEKVHTEEMSLSDKYIIEILNKVNYIADAVDDIKKQLDKIAAQIEGYQSLVEKQIDLAVSPDEVERIIHAFSEECSERILREVNSQNAVQEYDIEQQKLVLSFGENAWNKMEESSRTFLVSSKVIFNNLLNLHDFVDYSGVCLLVTKALEVEMSKRFCKKYLEYLKEKYPGKRNYCKFPSVLIDKYGNPIKPKHFTLGTVAYVLCYLKTSDISEEQFDYNKKELLEYSKEKLISGKTNEEIFEMLTDYAEDIETVKNDYRNPSAHTNKLQRIDAEQCFDLVIDVEKLMKRMLDSFDE